MAVKLRTDQLDGAGNNTPLKPISDGNGNLTCYPCISKNPISTLFTTAKCLVNDKLVSNMNELPATNTLFKTVYDTRSMQETIESTNAIIPQSLVYTAPAISSITVPTSTVLINNASTSASVLVAGTVINGVTILSNVNVTFTANQVISSPTNIELCYNKYYFYYTLPAITCAYTQDVSVVVPPITMPINTPSFPNRASYSQKCQNLFNTFKEQTLTCALPLPLFQANEWIPLHTKVEIDFNVNTNWHN